MIGLLSEEEAAMRKNGKSEPLGEAAGQGQLWLQLPRLVREALYETVIAAGLACVDEVLEAERSEGTEGILLVRGPNVMKGYLDAASSTDLLDGWYRTGERASVDSDGFLRIARLTV